MAAREPGPYPIDHVVAVETVQPESSALRTDSPQQAVREVAVRARKASIALAAASRAVKDAALHAMADALLAASTDLIAANELDVQAAAANGTSTSMLDRLTLTEARIEAMASGLRKVAVLPDPVGEVVRGSTLANGLEVRQVRVPLGVVGIVYEARPNVTVDAAGLCLRAGTSRCCVAAARRTGATPPWSACCGWRPRASGCLLTWSIWCPAPTTPPCRRCFGCGAWST